MKQRLYILLAMLSLVLLLGIGGGKAEAASVCDEVSHSLAIDEQEQSFAPCHNFVDQSGRRGSTTTSVSGSSTLVKSVESRRLANSSACGVNMAIASQYSTRGYSHSCNFPFEHLPQKELFYTFRNLRI